MTRPFRFVAAALVGVTCCAALVAAQQPPITNGQVHVQPAGPSFVQSFTSLVASEADVAWIGYTVATARAQRDMDCYGNTDVTPKHGGTVRLEGSDRLVVMFRVAGKRVDRIRMFSEDCQLDAGGRPVRWFESVKPADSLALLESLIASDADRRDRIRGGAMAALSMHADPAATDALIRMARSSTTPGIRGDALFWLAQRAGQKSAALITERIEQDPDTEVKKRAVFALSQLPKDEGVPLLINVARTNSNPAVRKQAMFWLGQSKDPRAIDFFAEVLSK
jgi:hypothetical protein